MGGFVVTIFIVLVLVLLLLGLTSALKGRASVYLGAVTATLAAWFVGLVLDANLDFGDPAGFLAFRILFPILAMGLCILKEVLKNRPD